ncbi:unnamed protein product [Staurois parvus]|uniref:Uncharacterized protein n=1 Tax=Staurois parvus TaxID=386267 RepID=A0ABN9GB63_9NEOB|nr:unnamed protein product [Staurois parvus]
MLSSTWWASHKLSRSYLSSGLVLLHVLASILGVCKALWDPLCFQPLQLLPQEVAAYHI